MTVTYACVNGVHHWLICIDQRYIRVEYANGKWSLQQGKYSQGMVLMLLSVCKEYLEERGIA